MAESAQFPTPPPPSLSLAQLLDPRYGILVYWSYYLACDQRVAKAAN